MHLSFRLCIAFVILPVNLYELPNGLASWKGRSSTSTCSNQARLAFCSEFVSEALAPLTSFNSFIQSTWNLPIVATLACAQYSGRSSATCPKSRCISVSLFTTSYTLVGLPDSELLTAPIHYVQLSGLLCVPSRCACWPHQESEGGRKG